MTLLTREAISYYNENNLDDDELIFEEVKQQLEDDLDFAVEDLTAELIETKQRWYEQNSYCTDYLNVSEVVDADIFADEVLSQVRVVNKRDKKFSLNYLRFYLKNWFNKIFKGAN